MDDLNHEGLVGTENGTIYYVNFIDNDPSVYPIPIVSFSFTCIMKTT